MNWEITAILGIIGLAGFIIVGLFNLRVVYDKSKNKLSVDTKPDLHDGCSSCNKLTKVLPLIIQEAIESGSAMTQVKSMELLDNEMTCAKEHMGVIRDALQSVTVGLLHNRNYFDEVEIIVGNIITIYVHTVEQVFFMSFLRNNWKEMDELEFLDMIERKTALMKSEWCRVVSVFFPSKRHAALTDTLKAALYSDSEAYKEFQDIFTREVTKTFRDARILKNKAEDKSIDIRRKLSDSIMQILKANNFTV